MRQAFERVNGAKQFGSATVLAVILVTTGCGAADKPVTKASPKPVYYGANGVTVQTPADADELKGTSLDFRTFIANLAGKLKQPQEGEDCFVGVTVDVYDPSGFAQGAVNECGGYVAFWAKRSGAWKEIIGTQSLVECSDFAKYSVPVSVAGGECWDGTRKVQYQGPGS